MVGEKDAGNPRVITNLLIDGNSRGNLLALLLVHQIPVFLLTGFTAVLDCFALLALPQGGHLLWLPPAKHQAVDTVVYQARLDLPGVCSSLLFVFFKKLPAQTR